jgi:hypothetical protein
VLLYYSDKSLCECYVIFMMWCYYLTCPIVFPAAMDEINNSIQFNSIQSNDV